MIVQLYLGTTSQSFQLNSSILAFLSFIWNSEQKIDRNLGATFWFLKMFSKLKTTLHMSPLHTLVQLIFHGESRNSEC